MQRNDLRPKIVLLLLAMLMLLNMGVVDAFKVCFSFDPDSPGSSCIHESIIQEAFSINDKPFLKPDIMETITDQQWEVDIDDHFWDSEYHFDACSFSKSVKTINKHYGLLLDYLNPDLQNQIPGIPDPDKAAIEFGTLLHPAADFYAHSNWIEQGQGKLTLVDRRLSEWKDLSGTLSDYAIVNGAVLVEDLKEGDIVPKNYKLNPSSISDPLHGKTFTVTTPSGDVKKGIISGSAYGSDLCPNSVAIGHWDVGDSLKPGLGLYSGSGAPFDQDIDENGYGTGLNKDTPERPEHFAARAWAKLQTKHEFCRLLSLVQRDYGEAGLNYIKAAWIEPSTDLSTVCKCLVIGSQAGKTNQMSSATSDESCGSPIADEQEELEEFESNTRENQFTKFPVVKVDMSISSSVINLRLSNAPIQGSAKIVGEEIDKIKAETGVKRVDLVGSGMGALAAHFYTNYGYRFDVRKEVLIGASVHGSDLIKWGPKVAKIAIKALSSTVPGGQIISAIANILIDLIVGEAGPQMEPHSSFIKNLNLNDKNPSPLYALYDDYPGELDFINKNVKYLSIYGVGPAIGDFSLPMTLTTFHLIIPGLNELVSVPLIWFGDLFTNTVSADIDIDPSIMPPIVQMAKVTGLDSLHWWLAKNDDTVKCVNRFLDGLPCPPFNALSGQSLDGFMQSFAQVQTELDDMLNGSSYQIVGPFDGTVNPGNVTNHTFYLDPLSRETSIRLEYNPVDAFWNYTIDDYQECSNNVSLNLTMPNHTIIGSSQADGINIRYQETNGTITYFLNNSVIQTQTGNWTLIVKGEKGFAHGYANCSLVDYTAVITFKTYLRVGTKSYNESFEPGDQVPIIAVVQYNGSARPGVDVNAYITQFSNYSVNGSSAFDTIKLFDDGLLAHDDDIAGDGIYSNKYPNTIIPDTYQVNVVASVDLNLLGLGNEIVNRSVQTTFVVEALPELTVYDSEIIFSQGAFDEKVFIIDATIHNLGNAPANDTEIEFRAGNDTIGFDIVNVSPHGEDFASVQWNSTYGNHNITVIISPFNSFMEKSYLNNSASKLLFVDDFNAPVADAGPNQVARVGEPVFFDGSPSFDDNGIASYEWDPDIDNATDGIIYGVYNSTRGYYTLGLHNGSLTVRDEKGNSNTDYFNVTVVEEFDTEAPIVFAGLSQVVSVREPVQFDGRSSQDNYGIASHEWDINIAKDSDLDNLTDNDVDLVTRYPYLASGYYAPGKYIVKLTVNDVAGNGPESYYTKVIVKEYKQYICLGDMDCDTIPDQVDNCPITSNSDQADFDKDGKGDACYCTKIVSGGGDLEGELATAKSGDVICLSSFRVGNVTLPRGDITLDCLGYSITGDTTDTGITLGPAITNTTIQNCVVDEHFTGIKAQGANNKLLRNKVQINNGTGIQIISGSGGRLVDNKVCDNGINSGGNYDITSTGGYTGDYNTCDQTSSWNDQLTTGCRFTCNACTVPTNNMNIVTNTVLCPGTYELPNGINVVASNVYVKCDETVLVGSMSTTGIDVIGRTNVKVMGCEVRNYTIGLNFQYSASCEAFDNKLLENTDGIYLEALAPALTQTSSVITNNMILDNTINDNLRYGIFVYNTANNEISGNIMLNNRNVSAFLSSATATAVSNNLMASGILLYSSSSSNVSNNDISFPNGAYVVNISGGSGNMFTSNEVHDSFLYGFAISSSSNIFTNNNVHDLPIAFSFVGGSSNQVIGGKIENINVGLRISNSNNNRIHRVAVDDPILNGIDLRGSSNNLVNGSILGVITLNKSNFNNITKNTGSIEMFASNSNNVSGNNASAGTAGIVFDSSNLNLIVGNTFDANDAGIVGINSSSNLIRDNYIRKSIQGIFLNLSNNNTIFNNYFNSTINANDTGTNSWNRTKLLGLNIIGGPYFGGNFWGDYNGSDTDGDGLGNTLLPYTSKGGILNGGDRLPLLKLYRCGDLNNDGVHNVLDVVLIINVAFRGAPAPEPSWIADLNGDAVTNVLDVVLMINTAFRGAPEPTCGGAPIPNSAASATTWLSSPVKNADGTYTYSVYANAPIAYAGAQYSLALDSKTTIVSATIAGANSGLTLYTKSIGTEYKLGVVDSSGQSSIPAGSIQLMTVKVSSLSAPTSASLKISLVTLSDVDGKKISATILKTAPKTGSSTASS